MNEITVSAIVDGKRIATLQVEALSAVILDTLEDAGRYIYERRWQLFEQVGEETVLVEWDDLTPVEQLNVVYQEMIYVLREMAGSYFVNAAQDAAGKTAEAEKEEKYL